MKETFLDPFASEPMTFYFFNNVLVHYRLIMRADDQALYYTENCVYTL